MVGLHVRFSLQVLFLLQLSQSFIFHIQLLFSTINCPIPLGRNEIFDYLPFRNNYHPKTSPDNDYLFTYHD